MKIENDTTYSKVEIRRFIAMARPPGTKIKLVQVRNAGKHSAGKGRAYHWRFRIKVFIPRAKSPHVRSVWTPRKGGYLPMVIGSRDEALLMLLAHELRHLWQDQGKDWKGARLGKRKKPRKGMVWGARGVFSERDADAWAIHKVRQYRRGELS